MLILVKEENNHSYLFKMNEIISCKFAYLRILGNSFHAMVSDCEDVEQRWLELSYLITEDSAKLEKVQIFQNNSLPLRRFA